MAQLTYPFSALTKTWCSFSSLHGDCVSTNPNVERILLLKSKLFFYKYVYILTQPFFIPLMAENSWFCHFDYFQVKSQ